MGRKAVPDALLVMMAEKFRMLADSARLKILRALMDEGEMNVGQIVASTQLETANASRHLKLLAAAGLLARRKFGPFVHYRLDDPVIERICELVCESLRPGLEMQLKTKRRRSRAGRGK
jgi:DNA-binding transcriptional ArsR family regulator